jgi:hypothetical protein
LRLIEHIVTVQAGKSPSYKYADVVVTVPPQPWRKRSLKRGDKIDFLSSRDPQVFGSSFTT